MPSLPPRCDLRSSNNMLCKGAHGLADCRRHPRSAAQPVHMYTCTQLHTWLCAQNNTKYKCMQGNYSICKWQAQEPRLVSAALIGACRVNSPRAVPTPPTATQQHARCCCSRQPWNLSAAVIQLHYIVWLIGCSQSCHPHRASSEISRCLEVTSSRHPW
jgi:hypothetical protein